MSAPEIVITAGLGEMAQEGARRLVAIARQVIPRKGEFNLALAGGSTPVGLYRLLAQAPYRETMDWSRTFIYFTDERCVPPDHTDSNYRMVRETLLDHVAIPPANIFRMAGELDPAQAAAFYETILRQDFSLRGRSRPRFDLILLGMGDDGHTASLFPDTPATRKERRLVMPTEAPAQARPAVPRLTLTYAVLNAAANVMFLVAGAGKAAAVQAVLSEAEPDRDLPARRVQPVNGQLTWLLDRAAAGHLN
jgi:6-phosphogluconolactonase